MSVFVIAEIGSNHDGLLYRAKDLCYLAKEAGADAVKAQFFRADSLSKRRNAPEMYATYKAYELPDSWLPELKAYCDTLGIEFMCTAYDAFGIQAVAPHVKRFKIASFEAGDQQFLAQHLPYKKPIILSTGMMGLTELGKVLDNLLPQTVGTTITQRIIDATAPFQYFLHCTSAYPCPYRAAYMQNIKTLNLAFQWRAGLSDHTPDIYIPIAATAFGARCIEKHFTDDRRRVGPDHAVSIEPTDFKRMVQGIRAVEEAIAGSASDREEAEKAMSKYRVV